jgi:hypothetical protein
MAAQVTISQLPQGLPLTGAEAVPVVQNGLTIKTTAQAIADLAGGGVSGVISFNTRTGAVTLLLTDVTGALGYTPGSVTSVGGTGTVSGLTLSGSVTTSGNLTLGGTLAVTPSDFASQTANTFLAAPNGTAGAPTFRTILAADIPTLNQNTTGTAANVTGTVAIANGGTGATAAPAARTNLGATTLGSNLFTLANVAAIAFPRINADNTVSSLDAASFRTAIGAGTSSTTGTVTNIATGSGLSGGPITATGTISLATAYGDTVNPYASKTANTFLAAPNGAAGAPTFRTLVAADVPTLNQNTTGNAASATALQTARAINGVFFDGTANITVADATKLPLSGGSLTGSVTSSRSYTSTDDINVNGSNFIVNTITKSIALYAYDVQRSGITVGGIRIDGSGIFAVGTTIGGNVALHAGNFNSYAPTLTGTGASGSWGISITGTAANVTGTVAIANGGTGATTLAGASIATYAGAETLTNKRINPRVSTTASTATLTPDISSFDQFNLTAQAAGLTVAAPTGTPVDGNKIMFRFLDNGTARAITWNATYTAIGVTLPTTTVISKMLYVGCIYNAANTRWDVIAVTQQA